MRIPSLARGLAASLAVAVAFPGQAQENPLKLLFAAKAETAKADAKTATKETPKKAAAAKKAEPPKQAKKESGGSLDLFPFLAPGGAKRVEVNLTEQRLRAYEGKRLVLQTNISSGRGGCTPTGSFKAGYKNENHYSSLYHNAHMPWSVQVNGNIFIHGFAVVPDHPASHGCIRVPITGKNPAKRLFEWIDPGTPVKIFY